MRKIGNFTVLKNMKSKIIISFCLLLLSVINIYAQDVRFTASAKSTVSAGDQFYVTYSLNAEGTSFRGPSFKGFSVVSGPMPSTSSSVQIINGQVSQSSQQTYTYILYASQEGKYTIPPATITVGGKQYSSNSLNVEVVKGNSAPKSGSGTQPQGGQQQDQSSISSSDIFLRTSVSKGNPLQGEQLIVTTKLYTAIPVVQYSLNKLPSYTGFWSYELMKDNEKPKQYSEVYDGKRYTVAEIRKVALYPQKSGKLTIDPLQMDVVVQVQQQRKRRSFFDDFFDDPFSTGVVNVKKTLLSNSVSVNAAALPEKNKPLDFSGAVGKFSIKSSITKHEVKANDAVNVKYTISGTGNLKLIDKINVNFPSDFEVYDPKITENINVSAGGISGSKTFDYLVIPRNQGRFDIKSFTFSYFDNSQNRYITLSSEGFSLNVLKGDGQASANVVSSPGQEDIKYIGSDIRFIRTKTYTLVPSGSYFFGTWKYFLAMIIPLMIFVFIVIFFRRYIKRRQDIVQMKKRKSTRVAVKRLQKAAHLMKNIRKDEFYEELSKALWGYLSDKFTIPLSDLSIETVHDTLKGAKISEGVLQELSEILHHCEFARFAPADNTDGMQYIYNRAVDIISKIESGLK